MSNKETTLSILLIMGIEAFIFYTAFIYAGNSSALGYVSFAGTLISIILAVLAIGYTYGESVVQRKQEDALTNQISLLNNQITQLTDITHEIKLQAESLDEVFKITTDLGDITTIIKNGFQDTKKDVKTLFDKLGGLDGLDGLLINNNSNVNNSFSEITINEVVDALLAANSPTMELGVLTIIVMYKMKHKVIRKNIYSLIREYLNDISDISGNQLIIFENLFLGSIVSSLGVLQGFELIELKDGFINGIVKLR